MTFTDKLLDVSITLKCLLTLILCSTLLISAISQSSQPLHATQWQVVELELQTQDAIADAITRIDFLVTFTGPKGNKYIRRGFWDGPRQWKVRFQPDTTGAWSYLTEVVGEVQPKELHGIESQIDVVAYEGDNPLFKHGKLEVSANGRYFQHADGTPFFWIGDTNWSGPHKATLGDWATYLTTRKEQGFNIIQVMMTNSLAFAANADGRQAYVGSDHIQIEPLFFQFLDKRLEMINQHGLVDAGALIWSATWNQIAAHLNPGQALTENEIILLARYLMARYEAYHTVCFLGGDENYSGQKAERWKRIGREVFDIYPESLVSMHPTGKTWVGTEFEEEKWFKFHAYQSGHWTDDASTQWIQNGPPAEAWQQLSSRPVLNVEPGYEGHVRLNTDQRWTDDDVRSRLYWSLLVSPTAGVTYGGHGVWSWETTRALPVNHTHALEAQPWSEAIHLPGANQIRHLKKIFTSFKWWTLLPQPNLIEQPTDSASTFIAVSQSPEVGVVAYSPITHSISARLS